MNQKFMKTVQKKSGELAGNVVGVVKGALKDRSLKEVVRDRKQIAEELKKVLPAYVPERPMKFPYTFSAKLAQFPYRHYYNHGVFVKYYLLALVVCVPVFRMISNRANSKENKAKWKEIRKKQREEVHH